MTRGSAEFPGAPFWIFWPNRNRRNKSSSAALRYQLTETAGRDIDGILWEAVRRFGPEQRRRYAELIDTAIGLVAEAPERPGSRPRDELGPRTHSFHIERAARRRGAA